MPVLSRETAIQLAAFALLIALSAFAVRSGHRGFSRVNDSWAFCAPSSQRKVGAPTEMLSEFCDAIQGFVNHA
jgi:hypothetical protein